MRRTLPLFAFLALNFGGLAIGARFTGPGVNSEWYQTLARAPWTPDGWVFGAAWTLIMVTFSIYMARLWSLTESSENVCRRTIDLPDLILLTNLRVDASSTSKRSK